MEKRSLFATLSMPFLAGSLAFVACDSPLAAHEPTPLPSGDYRGEMRALVRKIADRAHATNPRFLVIPQNGLPLLTEDGSPGSAPASAYVSAIDAVSQEDVFYGFDRDDEPTSPLVRTGLVDRLHLANRLGLVSLVTNYCSTRAKMDDAYARSLASGFVSFSADHRELDDVPRYPSAPDRVNTNDVTSIRDAQNYLYLLNPQFPTRDAYLAQLRATNHDVLILDLFRDSVPLTRAEVESLKRKANGGRCLVVAYLSIGQAEDYRFYFQSSWRRHPPAFLGAEDPEWRGNYYVAYWDPAWQALLLDGDGSYLARVLDAGFDGVFLDLIDAYEFWEDR